MHQAAELVVAGYAALAVPEDVDRRQVQVLAVVPRQVLEVPRIVVQRDRTRVARAERVEQVRHRQPLGDGGRPPSGDLVELPLLEQPAGHGGMERVIVRHQRMHAIDGDELLGQRIRRGVMIRLRADDATEQLAVVEECSASSSRSSPTRPDQFTFIASLMIGCGTIAGVHSTV